MDESPHTELFERYQRLIEISRDIASTLDLNILLDRIIQAAKDFSGAEAVSILLYDESQSQLYFQATTNIDDKLMRGLIVPVERSLAGWIVMNRQPVNISDVNQDKRHFRKIAREIQVEVTSLLGVPMVTKNKVIGVLEAINKHNGDFTPQDQEFLMILGAQAAVAIENARLFQQSDLIAEFVHEIRTPLSSINTATHLLLHPKISEEKRQHMGEVIKKETTRLTDMSNRFLDLARLESGRSPYRFKEFELNILLEECADLIRARAQESGLILTTQWGPSLPKVNGDYTKLKQALINLLSNAIKYNRLEGEITLSTHVESDSVAISVSDTGIGIPMEHLPNLFTKFYRVPGMEEYAPGTGLGLSIVQQIINGHGGHVTVASKIGEGSTFTIHLPR